MNQKELNLEEILKQLSAPKAKAPEMYGPPSGNAVYYGSGCVPKG